MFYNYKNIFLLLASLLVFTMMGCKKNGLEYPDCFEDEENFIPGERFGSCDEFFMYIIIDDTKLLTITIDEKALGVTNTCNSFNVADFSQAINIELDIHENHPDSVYPNTSFLCTDAAFAPVKPIGQINTFKAVDGIITTAVSKENSLRELCESYDVSIKLENLKFIIQNPYEEIVIPKIVFKNSRVGFCIG